MSTADTMFPPGATQRDWVADGILAVSITLVAIIPYVVLSEPRPASATYVALSAALTLPLALRRHAPLAMLALVTLAGAFQLVLLPVPTISLVVVPMVAYSVARWIPGAIARSVVVVDADGTVAYTEVVPEITTEPDYDAALAALG